LVSYDVRFSISSFPVLAEVRHGRTWERNLLSLNHSTIQTVES
jgi:hypothetical protein